MADCTHAQQCTLDVDVEKRLKLFDRAVFDRPRLLDTYLRFRLLLVCRQNASFLTHPCTVDAVVNSPKFILYTFYHELYALFAADIDLYGDGAELEVYGFSFSFICSTLSCS